MRDLPEYYHVLLAGHNDQEKNRYCTCIIKFFRKTYWSGDVLKRYSAFTSMALRVAGIPSNIYELLKSYLFERTAIKAHATTEEPCHPVSQSWWRQTLEERPVYKLKKWLSQWQSGLCWWACLPQAKKQQPSFWKGDTKRGTYRERDSSFTTCHLMAKYCI